MSQVPIRQLVSVLQIQVNVSALQENVLASTALSRMSSKLAAVILHACAPATLRNAVVPQVAAFVTRARSRKSKTLVTTRIPAAVEATKRFALDRPGIALATVAQSRQHLHNSISCHWPTFRFELGASDSHELLSCV
jgi:hypothetical protein